MHKVLTFFHTKLSDGSSVCVFIDKSGEIGVGRMVNGVVVDTSYMKEIGHMTAIFIGIACLAGVILSGTATNTLMSVLSMPSIAGLLLTGHGSGWIPVVFWILGSIAAAWITVLMQKRDLDPGFTPTMIWSFLCGTALIIWAVKVVGLSSLDLGAALWERDYYDTLIFPETLINVLLLHLHVFIINIIFSSLFSVFTFSPLSINSSLKVNSYMFPIIVAMPFITWAFNSLVFEPTAANIFAGISPLTSALGLAEADLSGWCTTLSGLLSNLSMRHYAYAGVIAFVLCWILISILRKISMHCYRND